jgi:RNA-directed DNA polymerase
MQALYLLALQPIAECTADRNSYGFRPKRSPADAMMQCQTVFARRGRPAEWILEGDLKSCFDNISHDWLLAHIPMDKAVLRKWLKAGFIESRTLWPTEAGTPQGGIISPTLANMALDGLERELRKRFRQPAKVNMVRYADDFIVTANSKELLEHEVKPLVADFLKARGLEISPEKTSITHLDHGFDFLGWNVRRYDGKVLIKPSKRSVRVFLAKVRAQIKQDVGAPQVALIGRLNPLIRGWANYHRCAVASATFVSAQSRIWRSLWQWAKRRHPNKGRHWIAQRYWKLGHPKWVFAAREQNQHEGAHKWVVLQNLAAVTIRRHIKVKGAANPFDPEWEAYFEEREQRLMSNVLTGRLRTLWQRQSGRCPRCGQPVNAESGWHVHHVVWKTHGGSDRLDNLVLLHSVCHRQVHSRWSEVARPGVAGDAFEGLEPDAEKLASPVLRGREAPQGPPATRLIGHLGQDPELRHLPNSGQPVASFSVATDEGFTDKDGQRQERTEWFHIVVFGKLGETCKEYLKKGRQVYVEGRLRTREYEARNNGGKRQVLKSSPAGSSSSARHRRKPKPPRK